MKHEQNAKFVAAGGSLTTAGGIGSLAVGASAAEITSMLATAGGLVGGGMAAGIGVIAAAPLLVGGVCYGLYKLFK